YGQDSTSVCRPISMAGAADKWLAKIAADDRERSTLRQYQTHVRLHILPHIGKLKLAKMTEAHVAAFRDSLLTGDKPISRVMAKKVLVSLKSILRTNSVAHLGDNVRVVIAKRKEEKIEAKDIPAPGEIARLIETATGRWKALIMTAALTGLRASELRGLPWRCVDLKAGELHVRQRADQWGVIGPHPRATAAAAQCQSVLNWFRNCVSGNSPARSASLIWYSRHQRDGRGPQKPISRN